MSNITIDISEEELQGVLQAYKILQTFIEKIASPNELYQTDFLEGLQEALDDVQTGSLMEVKSFEDFIR
jgi:hypothetical protein